MAAAQFARWLLEQEARAMVDRIDRVRPFVLQSTMVPAAALMPATQLAIEAYLLSGRRRLRRQVLSYIGWLRGPGRTAAPSELQRRFTVLRLSFNTALTQLELFADAIAQRSEAETGVWLSGLDVAALDALRLPAAPYPAPPILCYLHRGLGGAIRRARTRLPGGGANPAAIIRIPRERMIGFGIASTLVHEAGHQGAALLGLVPALRAAIRREASRRPAPEHPTWQLWERWVSEIVADLWALGRIGIASTLGLIETVSLPRHFIFSGGLEDPHPYPWIRVQLSCALGHELYPHPQWRRLALVWAALYPTAGLATARRLEIARLWRTVPDLAALLAGYRPPALGGRSLRQALASDDRTPDRLGERFEAWRARPLLMAQAPPTLAFAALGHARFNGLLGPEDEARQLDRLITHWALRSTLVAAARDAEALPASLALAAS